MGILDSLPRWNRQELPVLKMVFSNLQLLQKLSPSFGAKSCPQQIPIKYFCHSKPFVSFSWDYWVMLLLLVHYMAQATMFSSPNSNRWDIL